MTRIASSSLLLLLLVTSLAAGGEVLVTVSTEDPAIVREHAGAKTSPGAGQRSGAAPGSPVLATRGVDIPGSWFIIPHIRVDTVFPFGDTTLIAVRNESTTAVPVSIEINDPPWTGGTALVMLNRTLAPKEVWPLNFRDWVAALPTDIDGFKRGWAYVTSTGGEVSVDMFQVNPGQDFATAGLPADITAFPGQHDFCNRWKVRSLLGGPFSGGTVVTFMLNLPLGGLASDPPSVTGSVYSEAGTLVNTFEIRSSWYSFTIDANIISLTSAGSLDIDTTPAGGGWVSVAHSAENRYSLSMNGVCLD